MIQRVVCSVILIAAPVAAASCDGLTGLKLPATTIASVQLVAAGEFLTPGPPPAPPALAYFKTFPEFCRVQGVIAPSNDSHIEFEVWLPTSRWNGKYLGVGNGGFAGGINYAAGAANNVPGLAEALLTGYAASATDTGHRGAATDAKWSLGHPEKIVDYGYRAVHETAEKSKAIVKAFYGDAPKHSYFSSCSNGGREALMEAQRFPTDYDGIIAGAPAYNMTRIGAGFMSNLLATEADPASYIAPAKLKVIESATLEACDALDGLKDGLIDDPTKCRFDPGTLLCRGTETDSCLTQPQVVALRTIYGGPRTSKGEQIYPGFLPGGETGRGGWEAWITGTERAKSAEYAFATQGFGYMMFQNPAWDFRTYNIDRDLKIADDADAQRLNAADPNLKAFRNRGGRLMVWHGWSDPALPPTATINYYQSVVSKMGRKDSSGFTRLYMVPGMQHCGGGPGPNTFGGPMTAALEHWVESGTGPDKIVATKYKSDGNPASGVARTRPLCAYPQVAHYTGSGTMDDAANFACVVPK